MRALEVPAEAAGTRIAAGVRRLLDARRRRATTLAEAILEHGNGAANDTSEARFARNNYLGRTTADKRAMIAFLENLILFKVEEESPAAATSGVLSLMQGSGAHQTVTIAPKGFKVLVQ